ncbi:11673_t:CDS:1, partial [Dentiscutata heterogama]
PEILRKKEYTEEADIYSFGVIMTEVSNGKPPYHDNDDNAIIPKICDGSLRPEFAEGTPKNYVDLAKTCMDNDKAKRPNAVKLCETLSNWIYNEKFFENSEKIKIESSTVLETGNLTDDNSTDDNLTDESALS